MVTEYIFNGHGLRDGVLSHRDTTCAREVVFAHGLTRAGVGYFVMTADKQDRLTAHHALDSLPIAIEGEGGKG